MYNMFQVSLVLIRCRYLPSYHHETLRTQLFTLPVLPERSLSDKGPDSPTLLGRLTCEFGMNLHIV